MTLLTRSELAGSGSERWDQTECGMLLPRYK